MIIRPRPTLFGLLFILRGSILLTVAPRLLIVLAVSIGVVWLHRTDPRYFYDVDPAPFTLLGLALSIFLGFRNNACYERWWEGRRQWGQLIVETRVLVREFSVLLPQDIELRRRCYHRIVAFAHALRDQLRGEDRHCIPKWLSEDEWNGIALVRSKPDAILHNLAVELSDLLHRGELSDILYKLISDKLLMMTEIQTSCERLRSTPMPFTYTLLLHRTAWLFCLLLPLATVGAIGLATPALTAILAYAFFGLDALGEELEEPFGRSQNALPLDAMVRTIEIVVMEALEEKNIPEPLLPKNHILF